MGGEEREGKVLRFKWGGTIIYMDPWGSGGGEDDHFLLFETITTITTTTTALRLVELLPLSIRYKTTYMRIVYNALDV